MLNWNGWQDTIPCVRSLLTQRYQNLEILIVDNASTDESSREIARALPGIELIEAKRNRGFAAGCNIGIRRAFEKNAEFVWLLNNDTLLPPDTAGKLVREAMRNPAVGMVGSVFYSFDHPNRVLAWGGGSLDRRSGYNRHFTARMELGPATFLTFASVLIRRDLLTHVGLLDEGFFLYYEDSDLCFRARDQGWGLSVAEDTAVLHREGASSKKQQKARVDRLVTASGLRFLTRHGRPPAAARMLFLLLRLSRRVFRLEFAAARAVLQGRADWRRQPTQDLVFEDPLPEQEQGT